MSKLKILVGFGTIDRPKMLVETLASLTKLHISPRVTLEVVVADNDPNESARTTVESYHDEFKNCKLTYLTEPRRGIVFMRNTIIDYALRQDVDLLAFIDDDEMVAPEWLDRMMETKEKYNADVVVGRVARILPDDTPGWVKFGKFFERPNVPTGTIRKAASTSNVLYDLKLLGIEFGLKFHPALNLSGSSDTYMFTEATERGAKIVWLNEDLVHEWIPKSRMTVKWQLQRAFRHTNCRTLRKRLKYPYYRAFISESAYGLLHFFLGIVTFPVYIFRGKAGFVHTLRFLWKGAGSFAGLSGFVYKEYENIHGY
ncbi:MAG: glycosyltransferase [Marinoscillum sp.]